MNNLEKLYEARQELEKTLKEVEIEQSKTKNIITEKRNAGWDRMFKDLYSLRKYSSFIDTGIAIGAKKYTLLGFELRGGYTLGFELRDNCISVISWEHFNCIGEPLSKPNVETYYFTIKKNKPFEVDSHYSAWMKYVLLAIENWDKTMDEIKLRLSKKMELEMKNRVSELEKNQEMLESELKAISK